MEKTVEDIELEKLKELEDKEIEEKKIFGARFKEIRIKVKTYDNMFYTVCVLNEHTIAHNETLDRMTLEERLETVLYDALNDLYNRLIKDEFIISNFEKKILNTKEIKETILQYN